MTFACRLFLLLALLAPLRAFSRETQVSRIWIAGQEAGTATETNSSDAAGLLMESREADHLERMGVVIKIELRERALKRPDGSMQFSWSLAMSQEPQEGEASWSPGEPGRLKLTFKDGPPRTLDIPAGEVSVLIGPSGTP